MTMADNINLSLQSIVGPRANGLYSMLLDAGLSVLLDEDRNGMPFVTLIRDEGDPVTLLYRFMGDEGLMKYYLVATASVTVTGIDDMALSAWIQTLKLCEVNEYDGDSILLKAYLPEYGGISDIRSLLLFIREFGTELDSLNALSEGT